MTEISKGLIGFAIINAIVLPSFIGSVLYLAYGGNPALAIAWYLVTCIAGPVALRINRKRTEASRKQSSI